MISPTYIGVLFSIVGSSFIGLSYSASKHAHNSFLTDSRYGGDITIEDDNSSQRKSVMHYPQWWTSLLLLIVGESFNFLAYGYAPTSVIAPLGTLSIIAGALSGYFYLGEKLKLRNYLGLILCILGASLVVVCAKTTETSIPPEEIILAITDFKFIVFCGVMLLCFLVLCVIDLVPYNERQRCGDEFIVIRVLLTSISSGFTVLATKAVASMIKFQGHQMFFSWITYIFLLVMLICAVATLYFTNKALSSFDSTKVLPAEFAAFTLVAVVGSAIMYHDFENFDLVDGLIFACGCVVIFGGVYLITTGSEKKGKNVRSSILIDKDIHKASHSLSINSSSRVRSGQPSADSASSSRLVKRISVGDKIVGVINVIGSNTRASLCFQQVVLPESRNNEYVTIDESLRFLEEELDRRMHSP